MLLVAHRAYNMVLPQRPFGHAFFGWQRVSCWYHIWYATFSRFVWGGVDKTFRCVPLEKRKLKVAAYDANDFQRAVFFAEVENVALLANLLHH